MDFGSEYQNATVVYAFHVLKVRDARVDRTEVLVWRQQQQGQADLNIVQRNATLVVLEVPNQYRHLRLLLRRPQARHHQTNDQRGWCRYLRRHEVIVLTVTD